MSRLIAAIAGVVLIALSGTSDLSACGDKFLLLGRALKYRQTIAAAHPANILLYSHGSTGNARSSAHEQFAALLTLAGHRVEVADRPEALARALATGRFDLVVVDLADGPYVRQFLTSASGTSVLVPMVDDKTHPDERAIKQQYGAVLKKSAGPREAVTTLDRALQANRKVRAD